MKIDLNDIRTRLSQNTAIDAKEIQALCDEVEKQRALLSPGPVSVDAVVSVLERAVKNHAELRGSKKLDKNQKTFHGGIVEGLVKAKEIIKEAH